MDNSRIYLKGKEVVTPFYLDEAKKEVIDHIKSDYELSARLNSKHIFFMPKPESYDWNGAENTQFVKEFVEPIALIYGWENIAFVFAGKINSYRANNSQRLYGGIFIYEDTPFSHIIQYSKLGGTWTGISSGNTSHSFMDDYRVFRVEINTDTKEFVKLSQASNNGTSQGSFLDVNTDYSTPYVPKYNGSPTTKKYVDDTIAAAIGNIATFSLLPVDTLPTEDIQTNVIYAIPSEDPKEKDVRIEYVYINDDWEAIGTTKIDLSNYYTKAEIDAMFASIANYTPVATATEVSDILNGTEGSE